MHAQTDARAGPGCRTTRRTVWRVCATKSPARSPRPPAKRWKNKLTTDFAITIAALENGQAQIGWFGANEYLASHARDPKVVPLVVNTGSSGTLNDALYYSRLVVKKGNETKYESNGQFNIDNIAGKRMSFVSTNSTSGFNMPAAAVVVSSRTIRSGRS
jgi:ABC-type phosphate/phosphonate transport system substrate-binding protein